LAERALEPLLGRRVPRVALELDHEARQRRDPLGAHGIALVGHRARADLLGFERLQDLALVLQQPQIGGELRRRRGDARQHREHLRVELACVGLPRDGEHAIEAKLLRDATVELAHLGVVAAEQLEEARLRPGRPFHAPELERLETVQQLRGVEQQVLHPQRHALADRGELRRLEVGVRETGQGAVAPRGFAEGHEHRGDTAEQDLQRFAHQQQVGVVRDIRARGAEMQVRARGGRLIGEMMDVRHHIVPQPLLVIRGAVQVRVVEVRRDLPDRGVGDVEPELPLRLEQRQPQPAPQADAPAVAPQILHRGRGIARRERRRPAHRAACAKTCGG
jgi:hypothetical protein